MKLHLTGRIQYFDLICYYDGNLTIFTREENFLPFFKNQFNTKTFTFDISDQILFLGFYYP